jgi:alpha-1,2-glucosyltransferase
MYFAVHAAFFIIIMSFLSHEIGRLVPEPFMDEIFHVRQALQYFKGNWTEWDPMITTPPGLYILSVMMIRLFGATGTINNFRWLNASIGVLILIVSRSIAKSSHKSFVNERALLIVLLPNLLIFFGLYYTDAGSVLFCLLAHLALIKRRIWLFMCTALISLTFRQTNIIWIAAFSIADRICYEVSGDLKKLWHKRNLYYKDVLLSSSLLVSFAVGVYLNGGIALGDKTSHKASIHLMQFFYCTSLTALFCWPILISSVSKLRVIPFIFVSCLCYISVRYGTIIHPYLIADNRHWTNFIWRRVLKYYYIRYALIPMHSISVLLISDSLISRGIIWVIGYFGTCAIVLIPSPLIEPRYYILPIVFFILNCKMTMTMTIKRTLLLQISFFFIINMFIIGMFLYKPFINTNEEGIQRRIW